MLFDQAWPQGLWRSCPVTRTSSWGQRQEEKPWLRDVNKAGFSMRWLDCRPSLAFTDPRFWHICNTFLQELSQRLLNSIIIFIISYHSSSHPASVVLYVQSSIWESNMSFNSDGQWCTVCGSNAHKKKTMSRVHLQLLQAARPLHKAVSTTATLRELWTEGPSNRAVQKSLAAVR